MEQYSRMYNLIGEDGIAKLRNSRVAVFGIGGVGSYTAEALCRAGVGTLDVIDNDTVSESNINRQLYALHSTIGKLKVDVAFERMKDINPLVTVNRYPVFVSKENIDNFDFDNFDYVVDAVDNVTAKLLLAERCNAHGVPLISCMGTGNKFGTNFVVADVFDTSICPLAKVMRRELKKRGIDKLKVVYSTEEPANKGEVPSSMPYVPPVAGMVMAGEVIKYVAKLSK